MKEQSYGIIPLFKKADQTYEVLVIQQAKEQYWGFPKGHVEEIDIQASDPKNPLESIDQTAIACAKREMKEEVDLDVMVLPHPTFTDTYTYFIENQKRDKTVIYYIGFVQSQKVTLLEKELSDFEWLSFSDAKEKLTHEGAKRLLQDVENYIYESSD
ncbi:MAG: hypothetical protein COV59_02390 [Candidatus Magasanikbacteria bacterium CG11_big_fil_rev_8_21_14_0_20_39_34]|uniref:Bis(5'-nucleosyl)-tetraphosphatase [asymmetrical] n=1 Tax=Candidatus Magasanikbacteria bacterium CG11_big_fil_rev_8_21_14_0_20_39_34 TaxID=1974653 RepID=A0A2H0N529_9BACT|nr:MAG: hypothetical protein COV59_02390 [Candidatus Magasanikbacteria bacterium CG11_big_fil_rev_8_21_14_0_20_39_34]